MQSVDKLVRVYTRVMLVNQDFKVHELTMKSGLETSVSGMLIKVSVLLNGLPFCICPKVPI